MQKIKKSNSQHHHNHNKENAILPKQLMSNPISQKMRKLLVMFKKNLAN